MSNSLTPYDLGSFAVTENYQKIQIDELVRIAKKDLRRRLVEAQIEALGMNIKLTTSRTLFNGERLWFVCPVCNKRAGTLFDNGGMGCRKCLGLVYRKQRYKGMIEG